MPTNTPVSALQSEVARLAALPPPEGVEPLAALLRERFGPALAGVLMYGSCLHDANVRDGLVDLYAVVDDYSGAYEGRFLRAANALLPPNVFYAEVGVEGAILRTKYAVLSRRDFQAGCTRWFHSYVWARFAQPFRIVWCRGEEERDALVEAASGAVVRFLQESVGMVEANAFGAEELWAAGLRASYRAELRPEGAERAAYLVARNGPAYAALTRAALPELRQRLAAGGVSLRAAASAPGGGEGGVRYTVTGDGLGALRRRARRRWRLRAWQGRLLSVLRLAKALLTFEGGVDYAAWKIERHTGLRVHVTPRLRRWPYIFAWPELWRLLRSGALK